MRIFINCANPVMDLEPPTTAMLAADALDVRGLDMIARLQRAHYVEGRRIADTDVLVQLAAEPGLDAAAFREHLHATERLCDEGAHRREPSAARASGWSRFSDLRA